MSTAETTAPTVETTSTRTARPPKDNEKRSWVSRIVLVLLCLIWTIPTIGLLVTSIRPQLDTEQSGWWSALFNPFSSAWTLQNYDEVLNANGMFDSFVNSIVVAVPVTILPIMFAASAQNL